MTQKDRAIIVIGLRSEENEIGCVKALGYRVLFFNTSITLDNALIVDVPVEIDLNDDALVIAKARVLSEKFDIHAVYTLNEYRVPLAARIASALNLPHGLSHEAALNCRNKKNTRQLLAQQGVGSANFVLVRTPQEGISALKQFTLPVIVKPSNDAGSNLVACCETPQDVWDAVEAIQAYSENWVGQVLDPEILLEEYLDGPEFSVEACTASGKTHIIAITAKQTTPAPLAIEVGHTVPAPLPESAVVAIHQVVIDALAALGVMDTVTHTEVKLTATGPKIIEVNARPGGDKIPLLVKAVTGYDLRELSLHLALGGSWANAPRHAVTTSSASVRFLVAERSGTVRLNHSESVTTTPGLHQLNLDIQDGNFVEQTTNNYNRLGYFIAHGINKQTSDDIATRILQDLSLRVEETVYAETWLNAQNMSLIKAEKL
jgi:S-sulfo-L-cysteine synthase (3-phospho-L-serine-dependent)